MKTVPVFSLLGLVFPPRADKLGKVPEGSIRLALIESGQIKVYESEEQGLALDVHEWVGYKWVPVRKSEQIENRLGF